MAYEWFISYRRKTGGENQAQKVEEILSKYVGKDKVFYDRESMREGNWREQINAALNSAEHFVLLVNEASAAEDQSNNVGGYRYEIETALKLNKKITLIEYNKESYNDVTAKYPSLKEAQKVTFNGEYNFAFEERLCKHFKFGYKAENASASTIIKNITIPENLVTRRDMLDKLDHEFKSHKCVVVSGIGGSGKTSLAYLYAKEQNFNNIAWVIVNGKIEDVFVDRIARLLFKKEDYEGFSRISDTTQKLDFIKSELSKIEGNNLLVFDINTNNEEIKQEIETRINNYLPSGSWKTLVLTRTVAENPSRFSTIKMDKMAEDDAQKLFVNNWKRTKIVFSQDQLAEITKELYYHPLLIEQTAIVFSKGHEKSAEEIISKIKDNSKVNNPRTMKILSGLAIEDKEQQDIYTYLINLCNIKNLSPDELKFLAVYVTWPEEPIAYEVISTLSPNTYEQLGSLVKKGILSMDDTKHVSIDSLVADVIREQINIKDFDYVQKISTTSFNKGTTKFINENNPIYLTYARNDKSNPEWAHISDIKDIIVNKFKENNIDVYDDDSDLKVGDNITNFENEIGDSEFTILIFSNKYFQSPHCMYELVQVMEAYNSGKKRKLVCIESGNCNLKDDSLRQYWANYGGERYKEELMGNKLTEIQQAAKKNGFYMDYIKNLYPFFTKCKYINVKDLNLDTLINDFKILIEEEYYLGIDNKSSGPFDLRTLKRKLRHLPKNTLVWTKGMEDWEMAFKLPELKEAFPIEPPPLPKDSLDEDVANNYYAKKHDKEAKKENKLPNTHNNLFTMANTISNLAILDENLGNAASAKKHFEEAVELYRQLPETPEYLDNLANSLAGLAKLETKLGDINSAKKHLEEGLEISRKIKNPHFAP